MNIYEINMFILKEIDVFQKNMLKILDKNIIKYYISTLKVRVLIWLLSF